MATINIGNLAFTHKGDYDGSTAYSKNDVVYYSTNGNAYIAKQATTGNVPTNATYWNQFTQGSGGIWDNNLSIGSAGQIVKVNSGGNALEFGSVSSGGVAQVITGLKTNKQDLAVNINVGVSSYGNIMSASITPSSTSSKIFVIYTLSGSADGGQHMVSAVKRAISGGATSFPAVGDSVSGFQQASTGSRGIGSNNFNIASQSFSFLDSPSTTSAITYTVVGATENANTWHINSNGEDSPNHSWSARFASSITLWEITV